VIREETLLEKIAIGIMFIAALLLMVWVPDFTMSQEDCTKQSSYAYVDNLCSQSKTN
jgi:competence protein ComGC